MASKFGHLLGRETSTVGANLHDWRQLETIGAKEFGFSRGVTEAMGPFLVEDTFGMKIALCMLHQSLDPGCNAKLV